MLSLFFVLVRLSCCFLCFSLLFIVCDVDFAMLSLYFVFLFNYCLVGVVSEFLFVFVFVFLDLHVVV